MIERDIQKLIELMKGREELARKNSEIWPVDSRVAGFFAGVAGGIASVIDELEIILEESK